VRVHEIIGFEKGKCFMFSRMFAVNFASSKKKFRKFSQEILKFKKKKVARGT
jgi:hypothetical protein